MNEERVVFSAACEIEKKIEKRMSLRRIYENESDDGVVGHSSWRAGAC